VHARYSTDLIAAHIAASVFARSSRVWTRGTNVPLCRQRELGALWREHHLQNVSEEALTIPTRFASFDDYWSPFLGNKGPPERT
jgi:hypothetical protein